MCGIAGIYYKNGPLPADLPHQRVLSAIRHRGPDYQGYRIFDNCALYHSRLEIIDTSEASNQPFCDEDGGRALVYNGEIFNYKPLRQGLNNLRTNGDVEVLFKLLELKGHEVLNELNGFFAFAFFDSSTQNLLLARDRFGVKPLYYYNDHEKFAFASELKALLTLTGKPTLNHNQVYTYFRLNYCSGPESIFEGIQRLLPGQYLDLNKGGCEIKTWYHAPAREHPENFAQLLEDAVKLRLQADVPLGTFLSGGIDSSIISALAKKHKPDLETFSIGFETEQYFDETRYAELVARHISSRHHVFKLREEDFLENIEGFLDCVDEPFADSSAFNFYLLSKYTKQRVKVALSGDGADELFKGYQKHKALLLGGSGFHRLLAQTVSGLFTGVQGSRDGRFNNKLRQLARFNKLAGLPEIEKQKFLASISEHADCEALLRNPPASAYFNTLFKPYESFGAFEFANTFDIHTVLADDMLVKADRFSMRHGLEVRNPFLDYRVVEYALNLAESKKISRRGQKLILRESFRGLLPPEIFTRSKKGFELPLQKWLSRQLRDKVEHVWLNRDKIEAENTLNYSRVKAIMDAAFSPNPGDNAAKLWAIIVFEAWMDSLKK